MEQREQRKTVTVLHCAISATRENGDLDTELEKRLIDRAYARAADILESKGATTQRKPESLLGIFGVPVATEQDALLATQAAVEIRSSIGDEQVPPGVTVAGWITLNTARVLLDQSGWLTGDAVTAATLLAESVEPGEILMGAETHRLVEQHVSAKALESASSIPVLRLTAYPITEELTSRDGPLLGRDDDLRILTEALDRTLVRGGSRSITLLGDAGVGKTRLLEELLHSTADRTTSIVMKCSSLDLDDLSPLRLALAKALDLDPETMDEAMVADAVGRLGGDEAVWSGVCQVLGVSNPGAPEDSFWAVRRTLELMAASRPVILALDGAQWANDRLLDLLDHIIEWAVHAPILLMVVARQDLLTRRPTWGGGRSNAITMTLEPLTEDAALALLEHSVGGRLELHLAKRIAHAAGGNPLFLKQVVAMLRDAGWITEQNGRWVATKDLATLKIPATVQALISARLDVLPPNERRVIDAASVAGATFAVDPISVLLDVEPQEIADDIVRLARQDLLRPAGSAEVPRMTFATGVMRDVTYEILTKEVRADLHERYGDWLSRQAGDRIAEFEAQIGFHLERAYRMKRDLGQRDEALAERAATASMNAGRRALARWDMTSATEQLTRADALLPSNHPDKAELSLDLAEALTESGSFAELAKLLEEIEATELRDDRLRARAKVARSSHDLWTDSEGWSMRTASELPAWIAAFEAAGDTLGVARCLELAGLTAYNDLRLEEAEELFRTAFDKAVESGSEGRIVSVLTRLIAAAFWGPRPVEYVIELCDRAAGRGSQHRRVLASALILKGACESMLGNFDVARELVVESRAILSDMGLTLYLGRHTQFAGMVEVNAGDLSRAERWFREGFQELEALNEGHVISSLAGNLARVLCMSGRYEEAEKAANQGAALALPDDYDAQANIKGALAQCMAAAGKQEMALALGREAIDASKQGDEIVLHADIACDVALAARAAGDDAWAKDLLDQAIALYTQKGHTVGAARAADLK